MNTSIQESGSTFLTADQVYNWGMELLARLSVTEEGARDIMDVLVHANLRGVDTHGIVRLKDYVQRLRDTSCHNIKLLHDERVFALVDGGNNPGPIVGKYAMNYAIKKARSLGSGFVSVRGSNHFSTAAYYSLMAADENMIGITLSIASPRIAPWGGLDAVIGNNPWSVAVPGYEFPVVLDMANTVVAMGKIRTCLREGIPLEPGWAMDSDGNPTTDAELANNGLLMPIGAHKGVCISMMVDLLCVGLSQSAVFSNNVRRVEDSQNPQNVSHLFVAVDFKNLISLEEFKGSVKRYADIVKSVRRKDGCNEIYLPGEIEWNTFVKRRREGFPLSNRTVGQLNLLAESLGAPLLCEFSQI
jgi:LDH2 family malate/lactate/ureidoglycolate dehydrogenase